MAMKNSSPVCGLFLTFDWAHDTTFIPDSIEALLWVFESTELCLNALKNWK